MFHKGLGEREDKDMREPFVYLNTVKLKLLVNTKDMQLKGSMKKKKG
jgi:hypothetical protein